MLQTSKVVERMDAGLVVLVRRDLLVAAVPHVIMDVGMVWMLLAVGPRGSRGPHR